MDSIELLINPNPSSIATIAITITFTSVMVLFVAARFWIVRTKEKTVATRWSECFLVLAMALTIGNLALTSQRLLDLVEASKNPLPLVEIYKVMMSAETFKVWYASFALYNGVLWMVKFAFLALYWNFFRRVQGGLRWVLPSAIVFTVAAYLVQLVSYFVWCMPISNNWGPDFMTIEKCTPLMSVKWMMMVGGINVANDVILVIAPLTILKVANFRRRETIALAAVFGIGIISVITGVVRMVLMHRVFGSDFANIGAHNQLTIVGNAEICTAIITFCLPAFRIYIVRRRATNKGSSGGTRHSQHGSRNHPVTYGSRTHGPRSARKGTLEYELEESRNESEERLRGEMLESGIFVIKDNTVTRSRMTDSPDQSGAGSRNSKCETEVFAENPGVRPWRPVS